MDFSFSQLINFMTTIVLIILALMMLSSVVALALFQNAREADEAWEEAIRKEQNKDTK
jgi:hypothetical protein